MENRTKRLIFRWSLTTTLSIAIFWLIWFVITGYIPVTKNIEIGSWTISFPFNISRLWDILIGPIWSTILVFFFTSERLRGSENYMCPDHPTFYSDFCLVMGLLLGLILIPLGPDSTLSLIIGIILGLFTGLILNFKPNIISNMTIGLFFSLGLSLVSGLIFGLTFGLTYGLIFNIAFLLGLGIILILRVLSGFAFWKVVISWLLAK